MAQEIRLGAYYTYCLYEIKSHPKYNSFYFLTTIFFYKVRKAQGFEPGQVVPPFALFTADSLPWYLKGKNEYFWKGFVIGELNIPQIRIYVF